MPQFKTFDKRRYRTVGAREGYGDWAPSYESTVQDEMDLALLDRLRTVAWADAGRAADLGCGTGRTGAWLTARGVNAVDGIDLTPEMVALARRRGVYSHLAVADVAATGLPARSYDLVVTCLVDEHLAALEPLYLEAARIAGRGGTFVVVGFHPHFIMASGMPTHFESATGEQLAIETHVHLLSEHVGAGLGAGWQLTEMHERVVDDAWVALKPKWEALRDHPVTFALVWRRGQRP